MTEPTKPQKRIIATCDNLLKKAGLPTYTEVENRGAMLGLAALESLDMGKQLVHKLKLAEAEIERLRKEIA